MSPRAAARLESLGFTNVFDYIAGKADWLAGGLEIEGSNADKLTALRAFTDDDVLISLDTSMEDAARQVKEAGREAAIVVSAEKVVLGRIRGKALQGDPSLTAAEAMRAGPATIRPDMGLKQAAEWMKTSGIRSVLVTTPEGTHLGTLMLDRAEAMLP